MNPIVLLRYLRVPLHTTPLLMMLIFSAMLTISGQMGVFGIVTIATVGSWFFKYGFVLLDHVIDGRREPPVLSPEMVNPVEQRPFGLFLLLVLFYSITGLLQTWIGATVVSVMRIALLALVPAMVASMSVSGRFVDAFNPVSVIGTIVRIPFAYAMLLIVIGLLWFVAVWMMQSVDISPTSLWRKESFLPGQVLSVIGVRGVLIGGLGLMLFMYLWLAMFACIGGTIYERRRELDVEAAASPERVAARATAELERQRDKTMDRIFAEVRGGAFANAGESVRKLIAQATQPLEESRWIYARAAAATDQRLAEYLAQIILPRLLEIGATGEALKLLRERLAIKSEFRPLSGGQSLRLAQLATDAGDRKLARQLLADFSHHYPNDPMAAVAAKLQAEIAR